jgi:transposase-like protein
MKKRRYTDRQVAQALRQAEQDAPVAGLCRKLGVSETTFYHWKKKSPAWECRAATSQAARGGESPVEAGGGRSHTG